MTTRLRVAVVLLCLLLSVSAISNKCAAKNPFLAEMAAANKIIVNSVPVKEAHCADEWEKHGTCCDVNSTKAYVAKDVGLLDKATDLVTKALTVQTDLVIQFTKNAKSWISNSSKLKESKFLLEKADKAIKNIGSIDYENHRKCWIDEMAKLRSASLCSTCSGRSQLFFRDNKALIDFETCSKVVNICFYSIKEMVQVIKASHFLYKVLNSFKSIKSVWKILKKDSKSVRSMFKGLIKADVMKKLSEYSNSAKGSIKNNDATRALCLAFTSLHKTPFIIDVIGLMNDLSTALVTINLIGNEISFGILKDKIDRYRAKIKNNKLPKWLEREFKKKHRRWKNTIKREKSQNDELLNNQLKESSMIISNYERALSPIRNKELERFRRLSLKKLTNLSLASRHSSQLISERNLQIDTDTEINDFLPEVIIIGNDLTQGQIASAGAIGSPMNLTMVFP